MTTGASAVPAPPLPPACAAARGMRPPWPCAPCLGWCALRGRRARDRSWLGLGRRLVTALAALARSRHPRVFLRVHPDNTAARRCYAAAGFEPVAPHLAALWNASQPVEYVWLSLATSTHPEPSTSPGPPPGNVATGSEPDP